MTRAGKQKNGVVLVTGASGFIGAALVKRLAERYTVVGLDRAGPPDPPPEAECICVDFTSDSAVRAALERVHKGYGKRIASVIHLAAYFDLTGEPNPLYENVTVRGTERLLKALQSFEVEQFVFASTMLVHAPTQPGKPIDEDSPLDPKLPYRASKIKTEKLIREQRGAIPAVFIRPAGIYDDRGHAAFLAHQIARIFERKLNSHVYPGNLATGQPYLHLDDLGDALLRIVERRKELPPETALLLAEREAPGFGELQDDIGCAIHGEEWQTWKIPAPIARLGAVVENQVLDVDPFIKPWMVDIASDHYEVDTTRARKLLDWKPRHSLRKTLPKIIASLKADPEGWYRDNKLNPATVADKTPQVLGEGPAKKGHEMKEGSCGSDMPEMQQHMKEMRDGHFNMLWVHFFNMALGAWLITSPFAFGAFDPQSFSNAVLQVTAERGLWDPAFRLELLAWSDIVSGALIVLFSAMSLTPRLSWAQWANAAVGFWLLFAPLVFWSPSPAMYNNDTLIGALVITFAILVPMMPGMGMAGMMDQSDMPPGWTYSPSTYLQRLPIIGLALVGFLIARQLAAYQLGHVDGVWEPFFAGQSGENGTEYIITSDVSKAWPVADGGLGAVTYMLEVLMGVMGDRRRWRTMPWMVAAFGIVVVPLGVISIYFIVIQPILIGTWCTLCLIAAAAMVIMIPYSLDELVAMGQFLVQGHRRGEPFWRNFFRGGASPGSGRDQQPGWDGPLLQTVTSALRGGVNLPWTLVACTALGVALMFTRPLLGTEPPMAHSDHLIGAIIVTVSVMALAEVGRLLRFINVPFGLWLIAAPWILEGESLMASLVSVAIGIAVTLLSLPRGKRGDEHFGNWDRFIL